MPNRRQRKPVPTVAKSVGFNVQAELRREAQSRKAVVKPTPSTRVPTAKLRRRR
jgi:hypothetical protein